MKQISIFFVSAAALACLAVPARRARADIVEDLTVSEMATRADVVVHGRVLTVEAGWDDSRRHIITSTRLEVLSYVGGSGPEEVVVRQVGGRVGDAELYVAGQPRFTVGAQVLVFLERVPELDTETDPAYVVLCMASGMYSVAHDRATGELVLGQARSDVTRLRIRRGSVARPRAARPLLLRDLTAEVRRARAEGGAR